MQEVALGFFGWKPGEFWESTPREFANAWKGWQRAREMNARDEWERTRALAMFAVLPFSKKKISATDLIRFKWDQEGKKAQRTKYGTR